ncbi:hypothetical protein DFH27DRAFT_274756 [Peziza echinospora]|nr:hypothetical protein DFH27DRAFT_274756 [Peziza echinospora]
MATAPKSPQLGGTSAVGSESPRNSLSQPDLKDLRQRARRFAQTLGNRGRANRRTPVAAMAATSASVPGVTDLSTGVVNSMHTVNLALRKLKECFKNISPTIATEWTTIEGLPELPEYSFDDIRPRVELHLSRIAFPQRYRSNARGQPSTQWEYTKAKLATLEKLDTWMGASVHPMADEVGTFLWKALEVEFEYLTRPEVPFAHLDLFCTSLQELTTLLPSSLFQVPEKAILEDPDMEAVMGLIYADILALVASGAQEIIPQNQPSGVNVFNTLYNSAIRRPIRGRVHNHHLHFSHKQVAGGSTTSAVQPQRQVAGGRFGMQRVNTNVNPVNNSALQSPTSPTSASVHPFRRTPSTSVWEQTLRTVLEQVKYHSQLLQSELSQLQALEQKGRFEAIETLLDEVDVTRKAEEEAKRAAKEIDAALERFYGKEKDAERRPAFKEGDSEDSMASSGSASPHQDSDDDGTEVGESSAGGSRNPDATREELEQEKAELVKLYHDAKAAKRTVLTKLLDEAGHIKCDVCVFTAYDKMDREGNDYSLDFSSNIREFTTLIGGLEKASASGDGQGVVRKSMLRL